MIEKEMTKKDDRDDRGKDDREKDDKQMIER